MTNIDILENEPISMKNLTVFIIVDVSRSMRGNKIRTVNKAMHEILPKLIDIGGADCNLSIAAMSFSNECQWMTKEPIPIDKFRWNDLDAGGWTNLGAACLELNRVMSRNVFLTSPSLSFAPVVILLSDGGPTDKYEEAIFTLNQNKWFKHSIKIAFAVGKNSKPEKLAMFTGDPDTVLSVNNQASLEKLIKLTILRSSEIGSRSSTINDLNENPDLIKQKEIISEIKKVVSDSDLKLDEGW